jgi:hypothetical protein
MKFWPLCMVLALLLPACGVGSLNAQTAASGALAGIVSDQSQAVIANADVEIRDNAKDITQSTKTDRSGEYQFFYLAPGRYTLSINHAGFREEKRLVDVLLGPAVSVNITLAIAEARSEATAVDVVPLIQAENGDASATTSQKQISELPNPGNDLTYVVQTTPGVVMNTDVPNSTGMNFSILGMPSTSYRYSIDGVDDPPTGVLGLLLGQNQVQEATVVIAGYSGQFGNAAGGNINYVTKSGGNQFHGNAQYYWNGRVLNANDWFNKAAGNERPFDIANQWAGSFGGPIRKDKLFFFFDTEGMRVLIPTIGQVLIPSPLFEAVTITNIDNRFGATSASDRLYKKIFNLYNAAPGASTADAGSFAPGDLGCAGLPQALLDGLLKDAPCVMHFTTTRSSPSQDALTTGRVDWNLNRSDRIFFRVQHDAGHLTINPNPISSLLDIKGRTTWSEGQAIETHTFGTSAASQLVLAYSHSHGAYGVDDLAKALEAFPTHIFFREPQFFDLGNSSFQFRVTSAQYQISEDIVKTERNHRLGFGVNLVRVHSDDSASPDVGLLLPQTLDAFYQGGADPNSRNTDFTFATKSFNSIPSGPTVSYHFGIYGQDQWHAQPNLSLTIALRLEHQSNPVCETHCFARLAEPFRTANHDPSQPYNQAIVINQKQAFQSLDSMLWSPRFSFAWQPLGVKHNTVLRGGIGIFYDSVDSIVGNFSFNPPLVNSFTVTGDVLTPDESGSLLSRAADSNNAFMNAFASGETLAQIQKSVANFSPPGVTTAEKRTHAPQYQRWSLQLQQAFGAGTSLSIGYFGHHGIHELVQNPNANAWGFGSLPAGRCNDPIPDCAPDPRFGGVTEWDTKAISNYHGMVVSLQHRFSRWSQGLFQANYTYSHALDEVSNGGTTAFSNWNRLPFSVTPQDPNNLPGAYGSADYDVRHSFNANYVWELPVKAALGGHGPDSLMSGWQVSGTLFWRMGLPYTVLDIFPPPDLAKKNYFSPLYGVPDQPLGGSRPCGKGAVFLIASQPCLPPETLPDGITPAPNALFVQAGCETGFDAGHLGASGVCDGPAVSFSQGRNRFRGPHYFNTDFTIMKNTKIPSWESATLAVGLQFFNFFNHPNFGFPVTALGPPTGLIFYLEQPPTGILGNGNGSFGADMAPRMIQLKAELKF